jgi:hypothetical protein
MKTKLILILTLFLCSFAPEKKEKIADIIDNRKIGWPTAHTDGHKNRDVEVYLIGPIGRDSSSMSNAGYALVTYRMQDSQLKFNLEFILGFDNVYDKVSYTWANDTILKYRLYNSSNTLSQNMSLILNSNGNKLSKVETTE